MAVSFANAVANYICPSTADSILIGFIVEINQYLESFCVANCFHGYGEEKKLLLLLVLLVEYHHHHYHRKSIGSVKIAPEEFYLPILCNICAFVRTDKQYIRRNLFPF